MVASPLLPLCSNLDRLSERQISSVSDTLIQLGVSLPQLQQRLAHTAMARAEEFEPWDLERMRDVAENTESACLPAGVFEQHSTWPAKGDN